MSQVVSDNAILVMALMLLVAALFMAWDGI